MLQSPQTNVAAAPATYKPAKHKPVLSLPTILFTFTPGSQVPPSNYAMQNMEGDQITGYCFHDTSDMVVEIKPQ